MTAFALKLIAMLTMLCDHCSALFDQPPFGWYIGRLAFPLYALMVVEACRHLQNHPERMKKYILTLTILAVVSEFVYDLAFTGKLIYWGAQNQILQFLTFVLAAAYARKLPDRLLRILLWIAVAAVNHFCRMGYYALGIVFMLVLWRYLDRAENNADGRRWPGAAVVLGMYLPGLVLLDMAVSPDRFFSDGSLHVGAVLYSLRSYAVVLLLIPVFALYNGQYGNPPKWFRTVYQCFYPAHLAILWLITLPGSR